MVQSYKLSRPFRVGPGWSISLSKYFGPISSLHTKLFITFKTNVFFFRNVVLLSSQQHSTSVSEVVVIFLQLILLANTAAFFYSLLGLLSHCFWEGDSGEEISTRWRCFEKINRSRDSWLVLRSLQAVFSHLQSYPRKFLLCQWRHRRCFVIVSFFLRNIIFHTPQYYRWLTCYVYARLCQCFGQGGCYFRCDKPCTCCNYTCTQHFCYSAVAHILAPSVNLAFRPKTGFRNKCRARAGFRLPNKALLQLCVGM